MKKIISLILSVLFCLSLFTALATGILRSRLTPESVLKTSASVIFDKNDIEVEPEVMAQALSSPLMADYIDAFTSTAFDYLTGKSENLDLYSREYEEAALIFLDMYEIISGNFVERDEETLEKGRVQIKENLAYVKNEFTAELKYMETVAFLLSGKFFIISLVFALILALVIILINKDYLKLCNYISIPAISSGLLLFIAGVFFGVTAFAIYEGFMAAQIPLTVVEIVRALFEGIESAFKLAAFVSIFAGLVMMAVKIRLGKKKALK